MAKRKQCNDNDVVVVNGLRVIPEWITKEEEQRLIDAVNKEEYDAETLQRRTQQYGFQYRYKARTVTTKDRIGDGELPEWQQSISERLRKEGIFPELPEQLIVNEYKPGQGIAAHVDAKVFAAPIVSLSLGSACTFRLEHPKKEKRVDLYVEPRTLIIMSGEARWDWKHSIPKRKKDNGIARSTRISLTWRRLASASDK